MISTKLAGFVEEAQEEFEVGHLTQLIERTKQIATTFSDQITEQVKSLRSQKVSESQEEKGKGDCSSVSCGSLATVLSENAMIVRNEKFYLPIVFDGDATRYPMFKESVLSYLAVNKVSEGAKMRMLMEFLDHEVQGKIRHLEGCAETNTFERAIAELDRFYHEHGAMQRQLLLSLKRMERIRKGDLKAMQRLRTQLNLLQEDMLQNEERCLGFDLSMVTSKLPDKFVLALVDSWDFDGSSRGGILKGLSHLQRLLGKEINAVEVLQRHGLQLEDRREQETRSAYTHIVQQEKKTRSYENTPRWKERKCICDEAEEECTALRFCKVFINQTLDEKRRIAKEERLCFRCLMYGHTVARCQKIVKCNLCGGVHHTLLHREKEERYSNLVRVDAEELAMEQQVYEYVWYNDDEYVETLSIKQSRKECNQKIMEQNCEDIVWTQRSQVTNSLEVLVSKFNVQNSTRTEVSRQSMRSGCKEENLSDKEIINNDNSKQNPEEDLSMYVTPHIKNENEGKDDKNELNKTGSLALGEIDTATGRNYCVSPRTRCLSHYEIQQNYDKFHVNDIRRESDVPNIMDFASRNPENGQVTIVNRLLLGIGILRCDLDIPVQKIPPSLKNLSFGTPQSRHRAKSNEAMEHFYALYLRWVYLLHCIVKLDRMWKKFKLFYRLHSKLMTSRCISTAVLRRHFDHKDVWGTVFTNLILD